MTRRVGVDVGGTFTDLVALTGDGVIGVRKVVSTPEDPAVGLFRAVDEEGAQGRGKAPAVDVLVHGTTIATNALLERRGAVVALVTTAGFEDLLWLRRQDRADLYDLARDHAPPPVARERVVGAAERMGPDGPLEPLTEAEVARVVHALRALAPQAVAVALLFAFRHPDHERRLAAALRAALPGVPVTASHEVLPVFREYERTSTTVAEAYLRPVVGAYVGRTEGEARRRGVGALRIMTSSGGTLTPAAAATHAAALALSGPAGGVVGARLVGEAVGIADLLTLDMGGTSADASLVAGNAALVETAGVVGGVPLALPAVLIETVSAGGGSLARVDDGGALRVGPRSAGARPGPACYGRGGTEPTVTDACLVLGWLDPAHPLADAVHLDRAAAERAVGTLAARAGRDVTGTAAGIVEIATAVMARALKRVSVARGVDPRRLALLPFGGAGPLFGCALADALGMSTVVIPPHPGVLSALGLAAAADRVDLVASLHRPLAALDVGALERAFAPLVARAGAELPGATVHCLADCRFAGQGYEVTVAVVESDPTALREAFLTAHRARHGFADGGQPVDVVNVRVVAERPAALAVFGGAATGKRPVSAPGRRAVSIRGRSFEAAVWPLEGLPPGQRIAGPAVLAGADATALLEPGWVATVHSCGALIAVRA
jgi:N-methylhydantoinase A